MRTTFSHLFSILAFLIFASFQAHALTTISTYYPVNSNALINDDVIVTTGGHIDIAAGWSLTISSGHYLRFVNTGIMTVNAGAGLYMNNGNFDMSSSGTISLGTGATIHFVSGGQLIVNSGTISCGTSYIVGNAPANATNIVINNGGVLQGTCRIQRMNIHLATVWTVPALSSFTLQNYNTISDPTGSNANYVSIEGTLNVYGNLYINTLVSDRITQISVLTDGVFTADNAYLYAVPEVVGVYPSDINSTDSYWYFDELCGVQTQGDITMATTDLTCYNPDSGWNGIRLFNSTYGQMDLSYCRLSSINTISNDYAISLENAGAAVQLISHCTIYNPTQYYSGNGIYVTGTPTGWSFARVVCTYVEHFDNGFEQSVNSESDIVDCEFAYNDIGCYFNSITFTNVHGCSIHENNDIGIMYIAVGATDLHECEIYNNGNYEIYVDSDPTGMYVSNIDGHNNNIYNNTGTNLYLVGVYGVLGGCSVQLVECWWDAYPPQIGTEFDVVNSYMNFNMWTYNPFNIAGYTTCGMVYPKHTRHDPSAQPIASEIDVYNYPNPFNPSTQIVYTLPEDMSVFLSVYSLDGKLIQTLSEGFQSQGTHTITFNAPATMASGMYMYVLNTPMGVKNGMMLLTK